LAQFRAALLAENHTAKRALTFPRLFSGIGNAYSDEILHAARLSPVRWTRQLTEEEIARLYAATRATLQRWVEQLQRECGERFPEKVTAFRQGMAAHGRYGLPCPVCATAIQRIVYADNETNYCPRCQTGGKLLADRSLSRLLKGDWPKSIEAWEEDGRVIGASDRGEAGGPAQRSPNRLTGGGTVDAARGVKKNRSPDQGERWKSGE
jgi:formamidopyrimidine-DNA glycosylase